MIATTGSRSTSRSGGVGRPLLLAIATIAASAPALAAGPPEIRIAPGNTVPACVTPERLMAFIRSRNTSLDPRFNDIAAWYKKHGEAWRVRWDYAFFQMVVETNYLQFQRRPGVPGDVRARQNNFAGIGATGGGVPGDVYPDVATGVLAQIQHLVAYSGERVARPVAQRTQLKQDDIIASSASLKRPVRYSDLTNRWAADRNYFRSIETIAESYRGTYCNGRETQARVIEAPQPGPAPVRAATVQVQPQPPATPPAAAAGPPAQPRPATPSLAAVPTRTQPALRAGPGGPGATALESPPARVQPHAAGAASGPCKLFATSYGGRKTLLIRAPVDTGQHYHLVSVLDGFERSMTESFLKSHAPGGATIGEFETREAALAKAMELCPTAS